MPIFEYQCETCGHEFEKLVFSGEEASVPCPDCNSADTKKLMSAASFLGSSIGTCAADSPRGFS